MAHCITASSLFWATSTDLGRLVRQSADCLDPFEGDLELPTGDAERDTEEPRIRARIRCTRSEVDASVDEAVEQGDLVVCLFPSGFPASLLEHAIVRNGFEVFSEVDEDEVASVGRRVGEVVRSEPRSYVCVGAGGRAPVLGGGGGGGRRGGGGGGGWGGGGGRAPILGEVRRQVVRGQEGGPEDILSATEENFV